MFPNARGSELLAILLARSLQPSGRNRHHRLDLQWPTTTAFWPLSDRRAGHRRHTVDVTKLQQTQDASGTGAKGHHW